MTDTANGIASVVLPGHAGCGVAGVKENRDGRGFGGCGHRPRRPLGAGRLAGHRRDRPVRRRPGRQPDRDPHRDGGRHQSAAGRREPPAGRHPAVLDRSPAGRPIAQGAGGFRGAQRRGALRVAGGGRADACGRPARCRAGDGRRDGHPVDGEPGRRRPGRAADPAGPPAAGRRRGRRCDRRRCRR